VTGPIKQAIPLASTIGQLRQNGPFPKAAARELYDTQLRANLGRATSTIRTKRAVAVGEVQDWEELRQTGRDVKAATMANLDKLLVRFEAAVRAAGGQVHWARDAEEANQIVVDLVRQTGVSEVVKVKSMTTQEVGTNEALGKAGIKAVETDLAELIIQFDGDLPSHFLVPAIHRNRAEIRQIFLDRMPGVDPSLTDRPAELAGAARSYLRDKFLSAKVAISSANFAIAESGTLVVVESEGNGRMCLSLVDTLISVVGIEKLIPTWEDLAVFLQLLPRSSTAERMNPYTSMWTGVTPGDGPQTVHVILVDNGRSAVLSDPDGRDALHCIRCSACLNVCPVYERTGGHAYGSVYSGPIGAVLSPQLTGIEENASLPYASSLCGACYQVCPVKIDIPSMLVHLRARHVESKAAIIDSFFSRADRGSAVEHAMMSVIAWVMSDPARWDRVLWLTQAGRLLAKRSGRIRMLPPPFSAWTRSRDLPSPPTESFHRWWARTGGGARLDVPGAVPTKTDAAGSVRR